MNARPDSLVLIALLAPAAAFLLLAVVAPLRRTGRLAGLISIAAALTALGAAILAWRGVGEGVESFRQVWTWLPQHEGVLATVGVLADTYSVKMLVLVSLVATLVQVYSLGYLRDESPAALGRYYAYQSLFAFCGTGEAPGKG